MAWVLQPNRNPLWQRIVNKPKAPIPYKKDLLNVSNAYIFAVYLKSYKESMKSVISNNRIFPCLHVIKTHPAIYVIKKMHDVYI